MRVTLRTPLPSARITNTSSPPSRSDMNAIRSPSGDTAGHWSRPGCAVRFVSSPPSAAMRAISKSPARLAPKASQRPSGDQLGYSLSSSARVSRRALPPPASITHSSCVPSREDMKAIRRPSGETAGDQSATPGLRVRLRRPLPSRRIRQMSPSSPRGGLTR